VLEIRNTGVDNEFLVDLVEKIKKLDICEVRKFVILNETVFQSDYHRLLKGILNQIYDSSIEDLKKKECILVSAHHMDRHSHVIDVEINFFACIVSLSKILTTACN
jgi:hypothetical protein